MDLESAKATLLDHARHPRYQTPVTDACISSSAKNPICGDHVHFQARFESTKQESNDRTRRLLDVQMKAMGCSMCIASSSLLAEILLTQNMSLSNAMILKEEFEKALLASPDQPWPKALAGLSAFENLRINKTRLACVCLPWVAVEKAYNQLNAISNNPNQMASEIAPAVTA